MDELFKIYSKNPIIPTGQVNGVLKVENVDVDYTIQSDESDEEVGEVYEQEYVQNEMQSYSRIVKETASALANSSLNEVDGVEGVRPDSLNVYNQFNFECSFVKRELPIDSFKQKILGLINVNNVVVIQGPTGCGKTTQVSQYILDDCRARNEICNIVVTQPRRIATINVARRVCEERGWTLGTICGYQVGLDKKVSPNMILTYMTTGVLLQKIIKSKSLDEFSHIIMDEVHERNKDLDFLMLVVRKYLFTVSTQTKVILMSATIEAKDFAHYFRSHNEKNEFPAPIIYVDKDSLFKTQIFFADQLNIVKLPPLELDKPGISKETWTIFLFLVKAFDKLDAVNPQTNTKIVGSILVFLPGLGEIEEANKVLRECDRVDQIKWEIIPLHSSLPSDEQAKAFKTQKPGHRKIILSTNIAESSITVPDTTYVIDFCLTKAMTVDPITKYSSLKIEWASHVNCEQRAGRVGRVASGRVYRLVPRNFYEDIMPRKTIPEMLRAPLDQTILQAKMLELNDTPKQILALALNPPNLSSIETTIWHLKEVGGLLMTCSGVNSPSDGDLTFLGLVMASLPLDVNLSKLIVLGHIFSCLEDAIIIAAGCSIQNIFSIPFQQKFDAYKKILMWADGSSSDLIALLNLYNVWQLSKRENNFENCHSEQRWCRMNFVSLKGLREWSILVSEIRARLERLKIVDTVGPGKIRLTAIEKPTVLKIITSGAFYPNYFLRSPQNAEVDEREAVKMVGGRDPFRSVFFTGMDSSQPGQLYVRAIKHLLKDYNDTTEKDVFIGFDGSSKIYVEFKNDHDPVTVSMDGQQVLTSINGKIPLAVYEAIRKRQLKFKFELKLLPNIEAWDWAKKFGITDVSSLNSAVLEDRNCFSNVDYSPIPTLDTVYIQIIITSRIDAGHFWTQNINDETNDLLNKIWTSLNKQILHPIDKSDPSNGLKVGQIYVAKYSVDKIFYRCKVLSFGADHAQVLFIDYGNIELKKISEIYRLPQRPECLVAPLAIECVLSGIRPSITLNPKALWSDKINNIFDGQTKDVLLYGKIYSVVNDVVHLELYRSPPNQRQKLTSLNEWLVKEGYAVMADEGYLSRDDHEKREKVQSSENPNSEASKVGVDKIIRYKDYQAPNIGHNYTTLMLKGPFSPLEMKIYGCVESSKNKAVEVEGSSVNAVLLDNDPQDPHSTLMVARYVGQTPSATKLNLRQTTMMPSVPGFPMLIALLFCPTMEPKLTDDGTRVASILCGLGCHAITEKPFFPLHDLVMYLDTELQEDEIVKVNKIRYLMNNSIKTMKEISRDMGSQDDMLQKQVLIKNALFELIYHPRKLVEKTCVQYCNIWKKTHADALILRPTIPNDFEDLWPLLWFVKLNNKGYYNPQIMSNLDELDQICKNMLPPKPVTCELCKEKLLSVFDIREHIISLEHKQKLAKYYQQLQSD